MSYSLLVPIQEETMRAFTLCCLLIPIFALAQGDLVTGTGFLHALEGDTALVQPKAPEPWLFPAERLQQGDLSGPVRRVRGQSGAGERLMTWMKAYDRQGRVTRIEMTFAGVQQYLKTVAFDGSGGRTETSISTQGKEISRYDNSGHQLSTIAYGRVAGRFMLLIVFCFTGLAQAAPLGWHHDAFSRYPDATPVTTWAPDQHVVWSTPIPAWGNASPVLAGDRLFISAEPTTLLCLSAKDGAILWQKSNAYEDLLPAEEAAKLADEYKQQGELARQLRPLQRQLREKKGQSDKAPDDAELKAAVEALNGQIAELQKKIDAFTLANQWQMPSTNPENGYASSTPACDGARLYAAFGNGIVACYDLDGNLQWRRLLEKPINRLSSGWGQSASPLLIGDIMIIQINTTVYGLKAKTGETAWQAASPFSFGSPARARIGAIEAVITPGGAILNVPDGKVLGKMPLKTLDYNVPLVDDDTVYWVQGETTAVKLVPKEDGTLETQVLWTQKIKNDRYYASPLLHDGLLYAVMRYGTMTVLEAKDGTVLYERKLDAGGENYSSFLLAGNVILLFHDSGKTLVLEPGREYKELARNTLEFVRTTPVCQGKRMYVRGKTKMWCLGE